ncbi:MAG: hypothetical protein CM1200mP24_10410 [Gammaproteobacteria bacterium]|nr:MAG: hypothetical protein CM1200mP24_10410 [Gammaproteobacteria bacterium]
MGNRKCCQDIRKYSRHRWQQIRSGNRNAGQLTTYSAIRVAQFLEPYHPFWFEEPVMPENIDEMARVAAHTRYPSQLGNDLLQNTNSLNYYKKKGGTNYSTRRWSMRGYYRSKKKLPLWLKHTSRGSHPICIVVR